MKTRRTKVNPKSRLKTRTSLRVIRIKPYLALHHPRAPQHPPGSGMSTLPRKARD